MRETWAARFDEQVDIRVDAAVVRVGIADRPGAPREGEEGTGVRRVQHALLFE